jgi:hypothetical protein
MARVIVRGTNINFDSGKYIKAIKIVMDEEFDIAVKKWLLAVLRHTPTYTGTARGTYAPLGRAVGHAVRKGTIKGDPAKAAKKKFFKYGGQSFPLGFAAGANYSDFKITKAKNIKVKSARYVFEFDQQLPYVLWNEILPGPDWFHFRTPPPWLAMQAGNTAFVNHMKKAIRLRFPKLNLFIKKTNI